MDSIMNSGVASGLGEIHFQQHQRDPGIHLLISKQFFA
jgi:hypothetical protein